MNGWLGLAVLALTPMAAAAEPEVPREDDWHAVAGFGPEALLTGTDGEPWRWALAVGVYPGARWGRLGVVAAWRWAEPTGGQRGLVSLGVQWQVAAARPRLVLSPYAVLGFDLEGQAPVAGAGARFELGIWRGLGATIDTSGHLTVADADPVLGLSTALLLGWRR